MRARPSASSASSRTCRHRSPLSASVTSIAVSGRLIQALLIRRGPSSEALLFPPTPVRKRGSRSGLLATTVLQEFEDRGLDRVSKRRVAEIALDHFREPPGDRD